MNGVIHFEFFYFSDEIKSTQYIYFHDTSPNKQRDKTMYTCILMLTKGLKTLRKETKIRKKISIVSVCVYSKFLGKDLIWKRNWKHCITRRISLFIRFEPHVCCSTESCPVE